MAETTTTATASSPPTESPSADTSGPAKISASQLSEHNKASDCWMAIEGKVYNVTDFVDEHPGGDEIILADAGKDGTEGFNDVGHSEDARKLLEPMYVGDLEGKVVRRSVSSFTRSAVALPHPPLPPGTCAYAQSLDNSEPFF